MTTVWRRIWVQSLGLLVFACAVLPTQSLLDLRFSAACVWLALFLLGLGLGSNFFWPPRRLVWAALFFLFALGFSWYFSPFRSGSLARVQAWGLGLGIALSVAGAARELRQRLAGGWVFGAMACAALALAQRAGFDPFASPLSLWRAPATWGNPNFLAAFLVLSWPLFYSRSALWWSFAALSVTALGLAATGSRASALAVLVQLGLLVWERRREVLLPEKAAPSVPRWAWIALVLLAVFLADPMDWARPTERLALWKTSVSLWIERPWLGWGPGSYALAAEGRGAPALQALLASSNQFVEHPHNFILALLCEGGLLLVGAFGALTWAVWPAKPLDPLAWAARLGLFGLLIHCFFDRALDQAGLLFFAGLAFGLLFDTERDSAPQGLPRWGRALVLTAACATLALGIRPLWAYQRAVGREPLPGSPVGGLEAELQARDQLRQHPQWAPGYNLLGEALARQSRFEEAAQAYAKALALEPSSRAAALNLGNCRFMLSDFTGAEAAFREAAKIDPKSADARFSLGYALFQQRRLGEAAKQLDEALRLDPQHAASIKLKEQVLP